MSNSAGAPLPTFTLRLTSGTGMLCDETALKKIALDECAIAVMKSQGLKTCRPPACCLAAFHIAGLLQLKSEIETNLGEHGVH